MSIRWEFNPELSYRWKNAVIPSEIVKICREQGEAECIKAIRRSAASKESHNCRIYIGTDTKSGKQTFLKKVYYGPDIDVYHEKFEKEFARMKSISSELFPRYFKKSTAQSPNPFVIMEYFSPDDFITLETHLRNQHTSNKFSEQRLITDALFNALIESLHEALKILYQNGLLYLDLQPENILINPHTNEIRLVDFTDCYDCNAGGKQVPKVADDNMDPCSPPAVLLTRAFGLLIVRLHYAGSTAYGSFPSDVKKFIEKYYPLFNDILCQYGTDPMEDIYKHNTNYHTNMFEMYEQRYLRFMIELRKGKF